MAPLRRAAVCGPALFGVAVALTGYRPGHQPEEGLSPGIGSRSAEARAAPSLSFEDFIEKFGRAYQPGSAEHEERRALYERSVAQVAELNAGSRLWQAGVSHLSDRSAGELERLRGRKGRAATGPQPASLLGSASSPKRSGNCSLPPAVSWEHLPAMRDIRDQDSCGSCWATATATMLRAHVNIYRNEDSAFSVQQLINCVPNPQSCGGSGGCNGATAELAMDYVMYNGLMTEAELPYSGRDAACSTSMAARNPSPTPMPASGSLLSTMVEARSLGLYGWQKLPENRQYPLMRALYEAGPVAVSVAANNFWNFYESGIMNTCARDAVVNHLVVLVAYGAIDSGEKYWTLQNSWGESWGEAGQLRLLREDDETAHCGWDREPEMGTACDGGPSEVRVCGVCGILYDSVVPVFSGNSALMQDPGRLQEEACASP